MASNDVRSAVSTSGAGMEMHARLGIGNNEVMVIKMTQQDKTNVNGMVMAIQLDAWETFSEEVDEMIAREKLIEHDDD